LIEDKIRVTMVEPGAVETELATHITDEEAQQGFRPFINSTYSRPRISPPPWPTASPGPRG
jgi:NADP-dependent 3-hydroxy acid dehydrogenase YdfG